MPLSAGDMEKVWFTSVQLPSNRASHRPSRFTRSAPTEPVLGIFLSNFQKTLLKHVSFEICKKIIDLLKKFVLPPQSSVWTYVCTYVLVSECSKIYISRVARSIEFKFGIQETSNFFLVAVIFVNVQFIFYEIIIFFFEKSAIYLKVPHNSVAAHI